MGGIIPPAAEGVNGALEAEAAKVPLVDAQVRAAEVLQLGKNATFGRGRLRVDRVD